MRGWKIVKLLSEDPAVRRYPFELYSWYDKWKSPTRVPASFVFNTDTVKNGSGEHWVALFIDRDWNVDYFDSYGTAPLKRIFDWLTGMGCETVRYSTAALQGPTAWTCGAYSVYFLHMRSMGIPLDYIVRTFRPHQYDFNDALVAEIANKFSGVSLRSGG